MGHLYRNPKYDQILPGDEIRAALIRNRITQRSIARDLDVSPSLVHRVIDGLNVSDRVRRAVAKAARIDIERIWPCYLPGFGGPREPGRPIESLKDRKAA